MTFEELMAAVGAGTRAGYASTGANLAGTTARERADIRAADREFDEGVLESEAYAEKQAEKNALLRTAGAVGGFFLGGPVGAGLGSAAMRTIFGERDTPTVGVSAKPGMFYSQTRKDQESRFKSTNDFIKRANEQFASDVLFSSIGDMFTARSAAKAFPGLSGKFIPTEEIAPLLDIESLLSPNYDVSSSRIVDPMTGFGAGNTPPLYDPMTGLRPSLSDSIDNLRFGRLD